VQSATAFVQKSASCFISQMHRQQDQETELAKT